MKLQRIRALTVKNLLRVVREPANLFMIIIFPIVMTLVFGVAFGGIGGGGDTQYKVAVVDQDNSIWSNLFTSTLNSTGIIIPQQFNIVQDARYELSQGIISAVLVIPEGFGSSIEEYKANPDDETVWTISTLELSIDQGSMIAGSIVPNMIQQTLTVTLHGEEVLSPPSPVMIGAPLLVESKKLTQFDSMMPGMFSFSIIFVSMIISQVFTEERQQGLLRRISYTPTTASDIFAAEIVSNEITGIVQVSLVLGLSHLMGFRPLGGLLGIGLTYLLAMLLVLCNVGFGLITATLSKSAGAATGVAFIFILPQMMLGSFIPGTPEFLSKLVPTYYLTQTLTNVFLRGAEISSASIIQNTGILGFYSFAVIMVGIFLYQKYGNKD